MPIARMPFGDIVRMPVVVVHGSKPGPVVWLSGAIHGDELNGVEIVRRVTQQLDPLLLSGTVLAIPMVNVFGVTMRSRYLPDRRDLNRAFPGTRRGSLTSRLAHAFFQRVARGADLGIDFHTGSAGRTNLPQIRCDFSSSRARRMAMSFGAPLVLDSRPKAGTLRAEAARQGIPVLLYEGGEAGRLEDDAIDVGVAGTLRILGAMRMLPTAPPPEQDSVVAYDGRWIRAGRSGFCRVEVQPGQKVSAKQRLAVVGDAVGPAERAIRAPYDGVVVGMLRTAIVHRGDPVVHLASLDRARSATAGKKSSKKTSKKKSTAR